MTVLNQLAHAQGRRNKAPLKDYPSFVTSGRGPCGSGPCGSGPCGSGPCGSYQ
ncbi:MAG: hypothetical protein R6X34_05820 [Chloroflexota bacterium]